MAKNYIDNLSEEVRKGLREKAAQGEWPNKAPLGYLNDPETHRIDVDPLQFPCPTLDQAELTVLKTPANDYPLLVLRLDF